MHKQINLLCIYGPKYINHASFFQVHVRIASPPVKHPCFMGINIPTKNELIANHMDAEELAKHLGADSLVYLSIDGLKNAIQKGIENKSDNKVGHCTACLTGTYPVELEW